jgi:hypothetical protein
MWMVRYVVRYVTILHFTVMQPLKASIVCLGSAVWRHGGFWSRAWLDKGAHHVDDAFMFVTPSTALHVPWQRTCMPQCAHGPHATHALCSPWAGCIVCICSTVCWLGLFLAASGRARPGRKDHIMLVVLFLYTIHRSLRQGGLNSTVCWHGCVLQLINGHNIMGSQHVEYHDVISRIHVLQ